MFFTEAPHSVDAFLVCLVTVEGHKSTLYDCDLPFRILINFHMAQSTLKSNGSDVSVIVRHHLFSKIDHKSNGVISNILYLYKQCFFILAIFSDFWRRFETFFFIFWFNFSFLCIRHAFIRFQLFLRHVIILLQLFCVKHSFDYSFFLRHAIN